MELTTTAFADMGIIPADLAFCAIDPVHHAALSANRNPDLAWRGVPAATKSLALLCHDPDVPSRGDDVNQEGRVVAASLPRVDFFHWALIDLPPDTPAIGRGEFSEASRRAASRVRRRRAARGRESTITRTGLPATRTWPATTSAMTDRARPGTTNGRIGTCSRCTRSTCRGWASMECSAAPTCGPRWRGTSSRRRPSPDAIRSIRR